MTAEEIISRLLDAVIVLDSEKRITGWMGAAQRLFGWTAAEAGGQNVDDLMKPRDANGNECCIGPSDRDRAVKISRGIPEQEVLITTQKGHDRWIGVASSFERDRAGKIVSSIAVARDISRRKKIDLAKSEVISAVSHELRSPLTSVKGFTSTLLNRWDKFDDATKKHLLLTINTDADRVTRLIGELLDVSRLEAGRLQLRKQLIDIPEIARKVIDRIQPQTETHTVRAKFPKSFPTVFADPDKVEQVVTNLVENAVKYTDEGAVLVTGAVEDGMVRVAVGDEGEGIPKEHKLEVFAKFFRRGEKANNPTGTGLGLYISKGLVEAHGGRIWVEDAPGGGALFIFTLPVEPK
jgi:hypothetical protein